MVPRAAAVRLTVPLAFSTFDYVLYIAWVELDALQPAWDAPYFVDRCEALLLS